MHSAPLRVLTLALAAFVASLLPSEARADCMQSNPFGAADAAARVVVARAGANGTLIVERTLKGTPQPATLAVSFNHIIGVSFQSGQRYLVFLNAEQKIADHCATVYLGEPSAKPLPDAVQAWVGAGSARVRMSQLVTLGTSPPYAANASMTALRALEQLGASPDLLAEVDVPSLAKLVATVPSVVDERAYALSWVLARLHAAESVAKWAVFLSVPHSSANHRPVHEALEHLANRRDPAFVPGRDFYGDDAKAIQQGWVAWSGQHGGSSAQEAVATGARERGLRVPLLHDRTQLALIVRDERDELSRRVALAACEQLLRLPTTLLPNSGAGYVDWKRATQLCPVTPPSAPSPP